MHKDLPDSRPPMSATLRRLALAAAFVASGVAAQGTLAATLDDALSAATMGDAFACVSGADRGKINMQLRIAGLDGLFADRVFCGTEMARSKPAPDVYLAAAEALLPADTTGAA